MIRKAVMQSAGIPDPSRGPDIFETNRHSTALPTDVGLRVGRMKLTPPTVDGHSIVTHPVTRDMREASNALLAPESESALSDFDIPEFAGHAVEMIYHLKALDDAWKFVQNEVPLYVNFYKTSKTDIENGLSIEAAQHGDKPISFWRRGEAHTYTDGYVHDTGSIMHDLKIARFHWDQEVSQPHLHRSAKSDIHKMEQYPPGTFDEEIADLKALLGHTLELTDQEKDSMSGFNDELSTDMPRRKRARLNDHGVDHEFTTPSKRARASSSGISPPGKRRRTGPGMMNEVLAEMIRQDYVDVVPSSYGKSHPWFEKRGVTWGSEGYSYRSTKKKKSSRFKTVKNPKGGWDVVDTKPGKKGRKLMSKTAFQKLTLRAQQPLIDSLPPAAHSQPYLRWSEEQYSFNPKKNEGWAGWNRVVRRVNGKFKKFTKAQGHKIPGDAKKVSKHPGKRSNMKKSYKPKGLPARIGRMGTNTRVKRQMWDNNALHGTSRSQRRDAGMPQLPARIRRMGVNTYRVR